MDPDFKDDEATDDFAGLMVFDGRADGDLEGVDSADLNEGGGGGLGLGPVLDGRSGRLLCALLGLDSGFGGGGGGVGLTARNTL